MAREFTVQIPVTLTKPDEEILASAMHLGVNWGREDGWKPNDINAALTEILLWSDSPADHGVEIDDA